jgi:sugar phosphate isomerase/epimerase
MNRLSRRQFLEKGTMGLGAAFAASKIPFLSEFNNFSKTVKLPVGFQVWTIKDDLIKDFPGTLKKMSDLGYKTVEMCSPPGYESSGFGPLMKISAGEMKKIINDNGLEFASTHYGFGEFKNNLDERIAFAAESGQKQMICSSFGLPEKATMSDWMKACDEINVMGMKSRKAGIQMGYHNHHTEFAKIDGNLIYDSMLNRLDPEYVKMQFQVAVISIGYKASDYFIKYPGRFISAHLADWSSEDNKQKPLGQGNVDWKEFFASVKKGGVKNIFVEMDQETFKPSIDYLKNL